MKEKQALKKLKIHNKELVADEMKKLAEKWDKLIGCDPKEIEAVIQSDVEELQARVKKKNKALAKKLAKEVAKDWPKNEKN